MIIKSPYDDVELEPVPLHEYVLHGAAGWGSRTAIIDGPTGRVLTYGELAASVRKAAAGLAARGVAQGDVLALCSPNSPEFAVAYYAVLAAGALVTTVNPLAPASDVARQLTHSGARWLITTAALGPDATSRPCPRGRGRSPGNRDVPPACTEARSVYRRAGQARCAARAVAARNGVPDHRRRAGHRADAGAVAGRRGCGGWPDSPARR